MKNQFLGLPQDNDTFTRVHQGFGVVLMVIALLTASGCGEPAIETFEVSGVVTYSEKPVPTGSVGFVPQGQGMRTSGPIGSDGRYQLYVPAGSYKVTVIALRKSHAQSINKDNWVEAFQAKSPEPYVPSVYGDPESSPISYTVEPIEQNTFDITIKSRKRRRR